jgi:hypothetical protein
MKPATQPRAWYKNAPERWEHMLGKITMLLSDEEIEQLINTHTVFEAASDGSFDPTSGISSFGWVATINKIIRGPKNELSYYTVPISHGFNVCSYF